VLSSVGDGSVGRLEQSERDSKYDRAEYDAEQSLRDLLLHSNVYYGPHHPVVSLRIRWRQSWVPRSICEGFEDDPSGVGQAGCDCSNE
jgi:hypothetical protein